MPAGADLSPPALLSTLLLTTSPPLDLLRCGLVLSVLIFMGGAGNVVLRSRSPVAVLDLAAIAGLAVVVVMTSLALVSMMFMLMARMSDPLIPRAMFGLLNTLLWFPSGAVYPQQAFPSWMKGLAIVDPFTYGVHAFKCLLLKNTGFGAIAYDLLFLVIFSAIAMTAATALFKRTL